MKKIVSLLLTLCLLISACSAFAAAEEEVVVIPAAVIGLEDDSAFQGQWKMTQMVMGDQLIDLEMALMMLGTESPMNFTIADGKFTAPSQDGKTVEELVYTFEESQLLAQDEQGEYVIDLLEDGRIAITMILASMEGVSMVILCEKAEAAQ